MTKKERDKLYKIIEIFHNKYYEVNERNISDFYKEIHVMFPTITQNDINWAFEKYLWKKEFKFKKLASILTMLFMLPLQLWAIKIIDVNGISLLFLLIPEIIAMFILAWFMMKEMIIEEDMRSLKLREDARNTNELRQIKVTKDFNIYAEGSVLMEFGNTKVICISLCISL